MNFEIGIVFAALATFAFWLDLHYHKDNHEISLKQASMWSVFWVAIAMAFAGYLYVRAGSETASLFLTGYALEKVLSVDNLFVIMAIFAWFQVPSKYQHRVLYWGIIGAIAFRGIFVIIGTGLLAMSSYVELAFAALVGITAIMMMYKDDDKPENYDTHLAVRITRKFFEVKPSIDDQSFFVRRNGVLMATPLFLCLMVVEFSDVLFAFDSVPAVIAVTKDPLIVYSAMMFAILGLRTLYFVLAALKNMLVHLEKAVIFLLFFISIKLLLNATNHLWDHGYVVDPTTSLFVVLGSLAIGVIASLVFPKEDEQVQ